METGMARPRPNPVAIMEDRLGAVLSRSTVSAVQAGLGGIDHLATVSSGDPRSGSLPSRNKLKIGHGHLFEERPVLALRKGPQHRRGLLAGVPVLAAADPDGPRKSGAEPGEKFLGRGDGR